MELLEESGLEGTLFGVNDPLSGVERSDFELIDFAGVDSPETVLDPLFFLIFLYFEIFKYTGIPNVAW